MNINTIFSIFIPKEAKFFPLLKDSTRTLVQSADYAYELFSSNHPEKIKELCSAIKSEETKNDRITADIFKALNETFITPFDREDIGSLADAIDDAVDAIHRSSDKVLLYSPENLPEYTQQLASIIQKAAYELDKAIHELSNKKRNNVLLKKYCNKIKHLEEDADVIYENGIMHLFQYESNAVELIKLKEIIQELEKSVNKINSSAKRIRTILVKYA